MMKKLFYIFIISIPLLFLNCNNNKIINNEEIRQELTYELYNRILSDTSDAYVHSFCLMEIPMEIPHPFDTDFPRELDLIMHILNEEDSVNILEQFKQRKDFKIDILKVKCINTSFENYLKRDNFTRDSLNLFIEEFCGNYISLSMPIFTKDNSLVYIRIGIMCKDNYFCGAGEERIYKRENGKWILVESFGQWIS